MLNAPLWPKRDVPMKEMSAKPSFPSVKAAHVFMNTPRNFIASLCRIPQLNGKQGTAIWRPMYPAWRSRRNRRSTRSRLQNVKWDNVRDKIRPVPCLHDIGCDVHPSVEPDVCETLLVSKVITPVPKRTGVFFNLKATLIQHAELYIIFIKTAVPPSKRGLGGATQGDSHERIG